MKFRDTILGAISAALGLFFAADFAELWIVSALVLIGEVLPRRPLSWLRVGWVVHSATWVLVTVMNSNEFDDHVYLYVAWTLAVAVTRPDLREGLRDSARLILGVVFAAASFWKLVNLDFIRGSVLTSAVAFDDRFSITALVLGITDAERSSVRAGITNVILGIEKTYVAAVSEPAWIAILAGSLIMFLIEAGVASTYLITHGSVERYRAPLLLAFALATYTVVPVVGFAALLGLLGVVERDFDPRWSAAFIGIGVWTGFLAWA